MLSLSLSSLSEKNSRCSTSVSGKHSAFKTRKSVLDLCICRKPESQASKHTIRSLINATIPPANLVVQKSFLWLLKTRKPPLFTVSGGFICYGHTPGATETGAGLPGGKHQMLGHLGPQLITSPMAPHDVRSKDFACKKRYWRALGFRFLSLL